MAEISSRPALRSCVRDSVSAFVTVVVVNYNCRKYLQRCLDTLACQTMGDFKAVVVDNASNDASADEINLPDERFRLIRLKENIGFAAANNLGAWLQPSKFIATLNPDAFPETNWLAKLVISAEKRPECAAFGSTQLFEHDSSVMDGAGDSVFFAGIPWRGAHGHAVRELPEEYEIFSPCAAAALYDSRVFWRAGGFDEDFFCFCEDVDLGFRIRLLGLRCLQVTGAVVRHVSGGASRNVSLLTEYYEHRNAFWMQFKNYPAALLYWTLVPHIACELLGLFFLPKKPSGGHSLLSIAKTRLRATRDGLVIIPSILQKRKEIRQKYKNWLGADNEYAFLVSKKIYKQGTEYT